MTEENFFGRSIGQGLSFLNIDLCEICLQKSPNWIESKNIDNSIVIRVTCNDCHNLFLDEILKDNNQSDPNKDGGPNKEDESSQRPIWLDDFIKEQKEKGSIEIIDPTSLPSEEETKQPSDEISNKQAESDLYSEAPKSFLKSQEPITQPESKAIQGPNWLPGFIQQALFGPNPEKWLETNGAFQTESLDQTIETLSNIRLNQEVAVKLCAIQCLYSLLKKEPTREKQIKEGLNKFLDDPNQSVVDFVNDVLQN